MQTKNYFIAIISIILIVGIVLFVMDNQLSSSEEDVVGEAIAKKATTKAMSKADTKTKISSAKTISTKEFCGDKTCVDGEHVSCYENEEGECECEKCTISSKSWEFQKSLKEIQKSLKAKKTTPFSFSQIDITKFLSTCQTEKRYETGALIIDAFMMEFLGETDEETLEDFAELLEVAYCDATDGEIVIKITPVKYTPTKSTQFTSNSMLSYQPFMEEDWDETFDELANDEEYGHEWVEETRMLTYGDFLPDEDIDGFYYEWLYDRSVYAETFDYYSGFQGYAKQMGYNNEDYDLLIVLSGAYNEDYSKMYYYTYNLIYLAEPYLVLCANCDGHVNQNFNLNEDISYTFLDVAIHEIGHFTRAGHACEMSYPDNCDNCEWSNDVMSYCRDRPKSGETIYNEFSRCSLDFFKTYYIHNNSTGTSPEEDVQEYYSCE